MGGVRRAVERAVLDALVREASPDGLVVIGSDGSILLHNARLAEVWGLAPHVLDAGAGAVIDALAERAADPASFRTAVEALDGARLPAHAEVRLADGRVVECRGVALDDDAGPALGTAWFVRDVTARRRADDELADLARALQASLLPPAAPSIPGMEVAARFRPADRRVEVGGDFYDVFRLQVNEWGVAVGDVCGSGARAASLAVLARHTLRAAASHARLPSAVLDALNAAVLREPETEDRFCSAVFAKVELDVCGAWVTLACAGHPRPMLVRAAGWIDLRGQPGSLLGLFDDPAIGDDRVGLGPGDCLVICTDGITEARAPGDGAQFDDGRLAEVLVALASPDSSADDIADGVLEQALRWADGHVDDDAAVLVLRVPTDAKRDPEGRVAAATGMPRDALPLPVYEIGDDRHDLADRPAPPREARILLPADDDAVAARATSFVESVCRSWRLGEDVAADAAGRAAGLVDPRRSVTLVARWAGGASIDLEVG